MPSQNFNARSGNLLCKQYIKYNLFLLYSEKNMWEVICGLCNTIFHLQRLECRYDIFQKESHPAIKQFIYLHFNTTALET